MRRYVGITGGLVLLAGSPPVLAEPCGDLLIVIDRSGSMIDCSIGGMSKETIAKAAITNVVGKFASTPTGLLVFPDTLSDCGAAWVCQPGRVVVDVSADGAAKVSEWLASMPPSCGGTPTGDSMIAASDYNAWSSAKKHYVLLLTDGQPTCQDGDDGKTPPTACDGKGNAECANPTKVYGAIQALYGKGIHTFVIGFAGTGIGCGAGMPFNQDTLNAMADYGGEALTGAARYYLATDADSLNASLDKILGEKMRNTLPANGNPGSFSFWRACRQATG